MTISLFLATTALGQSITTGQISGTVADPSGAVVPNAAVKVSEAATGYAKTVTTNSSGVFVASGLQPGTYQVNVTAQGFASVSVPSVIVNAARTTNLPIQVKVGEQTETVEVSGQTQELNTTSATLHTTINPEQLQNLPLAGRDVLPFAELAPGAVNAEANQRYTTINGLPAAALNISVDGVNNNFQRYRTSTTGFFTAAPLRLGAFDELTVSTSDLTADAGAEGSTTLRFVTKRGTNQFHGSLFWQAQNTMFNANDYRNKARGLPRASQHLNDFGGNLGGPIWKNKLFFFVNLEEEANHAASTHTTQVFTPAATTGDFTYMGTDNALHTVNLLALAGANGFPSGVNSITGGMISQIATLAQNQNLRAGSHDTGPYATPVTSTLSWLQPTTNQHWWPTVRVDFQIKPTLAWHGSWDAQWYTITASPNYPGAKYSGNGWWANYYTLGNGVDWTISSHLLNQFNFGILHTREEFNPDTQGDPFASQGEAVINPPLGVNALVPGFILPIPRDNPVYNPSDNLTWTHGNHTFTFGGDLRISTMNETENNNPPTYSTGILSQDPANSIFTPANFPNINTGNSNAQLKAAKSLYSFLVGRLSGVSGFNYVSGKTGNFAVEGAIVNREKQTVGGVYFQDAWRATSHFALNYGFRWQLSGAVTNTSKFWTGPSYADLLGPSKGLFQPGTLTGNMNPQINLTPHPYRSSLVQPAPNFGFAWNPDFGDSGILGKLFGGNNTVIRGGASISYYDEGWTTVENTNAFTNPGAGQQVSLTPSVDFTPGSLALGGNIPPLVGFPQTFGFPLPESAFTFTGQAFAAVDPNIRAPYTESWNFGIQRRLPGNNILELNYVGNHVVHSWLGYDLNEVNIFENGFLKEFNNAVTNYNINQANGMGATFADNTGAPGLVPLPIFDTAFAGQPASAGFGNTDFISMLQQGQAGLLASQLAGSYTYLCNMVGGNAAFTPCAGSGGTGTYPINFFQANPYAAGAFLQYLSDPGWSNYNGLQVQWKHPVGRSLMFMANYTWSHSLSNRFLGDYYTSDEALQNFVTLRNPKLSNGPSPYDVRHQFKIYGTYALPFGSGRKFHPDSSILNGIIGGWTVGATLVAHTGLPFKLESGYNTYNYSYGYWPAASDSGVVLNGVTVGQLQSNVGVFPGPNASTPVVYFNPNFLKSNPNAIGYPTTPGQLGQFIYLYGPKYFNTDIAILKSIPIKEHMRFDIHAEMINAFNHPNWGVPGPHGNSPADYMNIASQPYLGASEVGGPRSIQFRMELAF